MILSQEVDLKDKIRLSMMYLLRHHDDPIKSKILFNDLEGLKVSKEHLEIIRKVCIPSKV